MQRQALNGELRKNLDKYSGLQFPTDQPGCELSDTKAGLDGLDLRLGAAKNDAPRDSPVFDAVRAAEAPGRREPITASVSTPPSFAKSSGVAGMGCLAR